MKTGRVHLRIEEKLLERTKKLARKNGVTLTQLVETLLRRAIEADTQTKHMDAEQI